MVLGLAAILAALAAAAFPSDAGAEGISFDREILPILSEHCLRCHGPDPKTRKLGLRLDVREDAIADRDGVRAIVPDKPEESALIARVASDDPLERMPPDGDGDPLKPEQIEKLREWIKQGAPWGKHWAFVPPRKAPLPATKESGWAANPIDAFALAQMEREGLRPSPPADRVALLRRLSLDLTGLPPSVEEVDHYLSMDPETAYKDAVERLLASPHYGERQAREWLDSAQYADSDGFEKDKPRAVWAWRDWVIKAFNANMPYDRFLQEQIAGDLMPGAGRDQIVATGFLRNSMINEEGGIDPEQFRMEAMFNRVDVIGRAALGLTLQCAQCHDHKYDPIKQSEYFGLMAFINNSHEACVTVLSDDEEAKRQETLKKIAASDEAFKKAHPDWREKLDAWEASVAAQPRPFWRILDFAFDDTSTGGQKFLSQGDGSYLAAGYAPTRFSPKMSSPSPVRKITAVRLELLGDPNLPRGGPGRSIYGASALTEFELYLAPKGEPVETMEKWTRLKIASAIADVNPPRRPLGPEFPPPGKRETGGVELAIDGNGETAWTTDNGPDRRNQARFAVFKLAEPVEAPEGSQIGVRLNQNHGGNDSDNNQNHNVGRFRVSVTDAAGLPTEAVPEPIERIVALPDSLRKPAEMERVFRFWLESRAEFSLVNKIRESVWQSSPQGTTQLVYAERSERRETHRLDRGDFLKPMERVDPGVPTWLNPAPREAPANRLALAAWLTDPSAPTTARAFVNRIWQGHFGRGIVETPSDLGLQGARPSHPELLDWLAAQFVESGWDVKALHRLIVMSATYRQSARATPELLEKDPQNRLLARGSRFRVDGEIVRDIALSASGLLNRKIGGPSVYPPAPEFLFKPPASYGPKVWSTALDAERHRRALYTFRFRSVPYPALQVFDTPDGSAPCVRRERSNTPLQALTLLNEPLFFECARALGKEAMGRPDASDEARLAWAFRRCVSREPQPEDVATLSDYLKKQRQRIAEGALQPSAILATENGDAEWAAWTLAARVMLSMDETITRQ